MLSQAPDRDIDDEIWGYSLLISLQGWTATPDGRKWIEIPLVDFDCEACDVVIWPGELGGAQGTDPATSQEARQSETSMRRNRIEKRLRELAKDGLRLFKGKKAMASVLAAVPESRKDKLMTLGYDQLWKELFLLELVDVFRKEWVAFEKSLAVERSDFLGMAQSRQRMSDGCPRQGDRYR
jgi:hypothetical protein